MALVPHTPKGRGVFATADIPSGTVLETCPVLVLDEVENREHVEKTRLVHYTYNWPSPRQGLTGKTTTTTTTTQAVVLGLGSMFNHSRNGQNVGWTRDTESQMIVYRALRDIAAGEELCISYGDRLTFVDADEGKADAAGEEDEDHAVFLENIRLD